MVRSVFFFRVMVDARLTYFCSFDDVDVPYDEMAKLSRVIDLDIDIGADAVDYKFVPSPFTFALPDQVLTFFFSLLKCHCQSRIPIRPRNRDAQTRRDSERGRGRDDVSQEAGRAIHKDQRCVRPLTFPVDSDSLSFRIDESTRTELWLVYYPIACWLGRMANIPPSRVLQAEISYRLILFLLVGGMLDYPCVHAIAAGIDCI